MAYFRTCPDCGSTLDPSETCDCQKPQRPAPFAVGMNAQCTQFSRERANKARSENMAHKRPQRRDKIATQTPIMEPVKTEDIFGKCHAV